MDVERQRATSGHPLKPRAVRRRIDRVLKRSIKFSLGNRKPAVEYALRWGRNLDAKKADEFIGMYVNELTLDYGERGRRAVELFLAQGAEAGLVPPVEVAFTE